MILAAGLGTRLGSLTERTPKAMVPVRGRPLIEHVMERLVAAGAKRIVVNTSRHGEQICAWLERAAAPGVEIALSPEPDGPYETGGGFVAAARSGLFRGDGPIVLHAVDVLSRIPLGELVAGHRKARARQGDRLVATLAVQKRPSRRRLLFDDLGLLGWEARMAGGAVERARRVLAPFRHCLASDCLDECGGESAGLMVLGGH
ncbi:MAG TPA: sugar phosphate nucleotidyltransferase [Gemmatimonadales bacterium]|nr:sugar phosphate nucleotidyltransferase [Gemmatimonadales bacterium]